MAEGSLTSWCNIYRDRISENLEIALGLVPKGRRFCAVLKGDAYGHGIRQVVPLVTEQGTSCIGITSNAEARAVRDVGFQGSLIRLRSATPQEIDGALEDRVEEQVASRETANQVRDHLNAGRFRASVHLSLNAAGMSRDGLEISTPAGQETCRYILEELGSHIGGICSHFASNDPPQLRQSSETFQRQISWVTDNSDLSRRDVVAHVGSSLTLVADTEIETDMYRCGAILYGILKPELGFQSTMDVKARVVSVQDYPKGASVGYDRSCHLEHDRRLACISIGYANGFSRIAGQGSVVAFESALAPVLGKVSMNAIIADVTGLEDVEIGDAVKVFGGDGAASIQPETAESQFRTIMADLYTDWGLRNHRFYL